MANPPPDRSWFRLPTLGRQAQPRPPSPQQPRPPVLRPAFAQSFRPSQPQPRPPQPPPPPTTTTTPQPPSPSPKQPRSPVLRPAFAQSFRPPQSQPHPIQPPLPSNTTPQPPTPSPPPPRPVASLSPVVTSQPPAPPSPPPRVVSSPTPSMTSPRTVNMTSSEFITKQSPKKPQVSEELPPPRPPTSLNSMTISFPPKSPAYPPIESPGAIKALPKTSPPPPISLPLKGEPKVLVQATFNKQAIVPNNSSKYGNVKEADRRMLSSYFEYGRNMKVLTIGGENKGANMELGFFSRRSRGGKQTEFNGNGNVGNEAQESEDLHKGISKTLHLPMNAFVNSNIQSVNSSILLDCSVTQHDPGVHFYLSKKPTKGIGKSNIWR